MADVRLLVQEEGRAARNLIAFSVPLECVGLEKITHKPPSVPKSLPTTSKRSIKGSSRVRSASTGRDKRSELQARYWAFLFGNLQRAVDAIYQTCEADENISECKEVILVLENFTRDFHNLIEWFKVKWAYETSPPPLRRTPLAWEVRKTSPCRIWSSSKPGSPTRLNCKSPEDQVPCDNANKEDNETLKDNKISAKEEVLNPRNPKTAKDSKNLGSKNDFKINKGKFGNAGVPSKVSTVKVIAKRLPSNKSSDVESKVLTENNSNIVKNDNLDVKNQSIKTIKQNSASQPKSADVLSVNNTENIENTPLISKNEDCNKKESVKNISNSVTNKPIQKSENDNKNVKFPTKIVTNSNVKPKVNISRPNSAMPNNIKSTTQQNNASQIVPEIHKLVRSKTTLGIKGSICSNPNANNKIRPGTSVMVRNTFQSNALKPQHRNLVKIAGDSSEDAVSTSVEVLTSKTKHAPKVDMDGWQTVRSRYRRGSTHNLNMSTRFNKPSAAISMPALCVTSSAEKNKKNGLTNEAIGNSKQKKRSVGAKVTKNINNQVVKIKSDVKIQQSNNEESKNTINQGADTLSNTNSTSMIAAIFKSEAELLEKRIQQFMAAQAERERIIIEEERKTEEADTQRSKQLSDEEAMLQKQIQELQSSEIDIDTETDETDGEMALEIEGEIPSDFGSDIDDMSLEDRYENALEGMSWAERMDTLAQLKALVARHPGRALELHQKLSSPSRKRSLPETLRKFQAKQACAQKKRETLLMEKSQRLRELLNKVEDVKLAKNQLIEDKRLRMESKLKRAEENRTQHLLEVVRKAHDEDSKLKEIAFINELEAQNKRHDFMALCQEQEERLQGIQEERQRRQEEKAAKEAAAEERRRALEAERQLRIQKMRQVRREREERVGKMQLEREKERQELAREKARDREERLSALHAAQLANQEELQKKIAQKQQESARRHVENIEHIRQRAVESSIMRSEEVPPMLKSYPTLKQCSLCNKMISNEVQLLSHLKGKIHLESVKKVHEGREPHKDELQKFNITQIKDVQNNVTISTSDGNPNSNVQHDNKMAKEKQKALKRRSRKIKQRIVQRSQEYEASIKKEGSNAFVDSVSKSSKLKKNLKEIEKLCQNHGKSVWSVPNLSSLERYLGDIIRGFSKCNEIDQKEQDAFAQFGGFDILTNLLSQSMNVNNASLSLPNKSIVSIFKIYSWAANSNKKYSEMILLSSKIMVILDIFLQRLEMVTSLDDSSQAQEIFNNGNGNGNVAVAASQLLCTLIPESSFESSLQSRIQDIVGYLVTSGLIDKIARHSCALIESDFLLDQEKECTLLITCYELLARFCNQLKRVNCNGSLHDISSISENSENNCNSNQEPSTSESHFMRLLVSTEAAGAVGALYTAIALSFNQKNNAQTNTSGPSNAAKDLALAGLKLLKNIAELDLNKLQNLLGAEGTSLQWRLIASHLIRPEITQGAKNILLLEQLFIVLGYFAVNNPDNQLVLQSAGSGPSVLQQLCTLPFPFYGDPKWACFTLPTLLATTHKNIEAIAILSCEMSYQLLEEYKDSEQGKVNPLIRLLNASH